MTHTRNWTHHCYLCADFQKFVTHQVEHEQDPSLRAFLIELWWEHQDTSDDRRCWNAFMSVNDPAMVVEFDSD